VTKEIEIHRVDADRLADLEGFFESRRFEAVAA